MKAAFKLLSERGYAALGFETVAREAGVGKTTIYRWWPDRASLAVESFFDDTLSDLAFPETGSAAEDFRQQLQRLAALLRSPRGEVLAALIIGSRTDPELVASIDAKWVQPRRQWGFSRLQRAFEAGQCVAGLNILSALDTLYTPLYGHLFLGVGVHTRAEIERHCDFLFPLIFLDRTQGACDGRLPIKRRFSMGHCARFILFSALTLSAMWSSAKAQLGAVLGVPCTDSVEVPPAGGYSTGLFGLYASCTATALCPSGSVQFSVFAHVYVGLACPTDSVYDFAYDGADSYNQQVNATGMATDLQNDLLRGQSYAFSQCNGIKFGKDNSYPNVCGLATIGGGGGGGGGSCYYGYDPHVLEDQLVLPDDEGSYPGDTSCSAVQ